MGVFRLFRYFLNKYPNIVYNLKKGDSTKNLNINVDVLAIDLNAIFHPCCQEVFGYGQKDVKKSLLHPKKRSNEPMEVLIKRSYRAITNKIEDLVNQNLPKQILYLAVDGVAGMSKQTQQRQRRFRYAKTVNENSFDPNCITTGTTYMDNLSKYISNFIKIKLQSDWKHLNIIFNNGRVPGEGEHKLIHYIKKLPKYYSASIVSPDADLIMLSLALERDNVYVFRENIFDDFDADYFLVDIDKLKHYILENIKPTFDKYNEEQKKEVSKPIVSSSVQHYIKRKRVYGNKEDQINRMIEDFIFYLFMLGNDFLPHIPSLEISNDGIEHLLYCYNIVISKFGFITNKNNEDININYKSFKELLKELSNLEFTMLLKKSKKRITFSDKILENNITFIKDEKTINFENYRKEYYVNKCKFGVLHEFKEIEENKDYNVDFNKMENDVKKQVGEFIRGMIFVLKYYLNNIPTFDWFYPYHYAPFLIDMYTYFPDKVEDSFKYVEPLSPFEQLLCVLPPQSYRLFPNEFHELILSENSPLKHMYPKNFIIDLDGKMNDYEGICILPFADIYTVKQEFKNVELNEIDKKRNQTGFVYEYFYNKENNNIETKFYK